MDRYGGPEVLELRDVPRPEPKANECLVRVRAASINDWDWELMRGAPINRVMSGLTRPRIRIIGCDVAGQVEAVGANVRAFAPGDEVFGDLCASGFGAFAEYVAAPEKSLAPKPPGMTFEQAASIPQAGMLAVQGLIDVGQIKRGQKLLLNGAGGGVGTFALQIAKLHDAEVTAVDSASKLDMLKSLGAAHVVDYARQDFTKSGQRYDLILDTKSNRSPFDYARALAAGGTYATVGGSMASLLLALALRPLLSGKHIKLVVLRPNKDLAYLSKIFTAGHLRPVIDGPYQLADIASAVRHFGTAQHKGKIVLTVA